MFLKYNGCTVADILLENVFKIYAGKEQALSGFSLRIEDGGFMVLLGPEGCGKTAVLLLIAGLEKPDGGGVFTGGEPVSGIEPGNRSIAMVFQNDALISKLTVYDNMACGLVLRKAPQETVKQRVAEAAAFFALEDILGLKPKALTKERRRSVELARAAVRRPGILLLDEPCRGCGEKAGLQMRMDIAKLRRRLHATVVYATPDPAEAAAMGAAGACIAVMDGGRLLRIVSAEELQETLT